MKIQGHDIPDSCPKDCPDYGFKYGQNSLCCHCPIIVCAEPETEEDKDHMPIVAAEEYRPEWAKGFSEWFKNGMRGLPHLPLKLNTNE